MYVIESILSWLSGGPFLGWKHPVEQEAPEEEEAPVERAEPLERAGMQRPHADAPSDRAR